MTENLFVHMVRGRLWRRNLNFICGICGAPGSSKSWSSLEIARTIDRKFTIDNVCFSPLSLIQLINSGVVRRGSCLVLDEVGVYFGSRDFLSVKNKQISYLLQTFRNMNLSLLLTSPSFGFLDSSGRKLIHSFLESETINYRERYATFRWFTIQTNPLTGKQYKKHIRVFNPETNLMERIDVLEIPAPPAPLIRQYEKKKREFTQALNKQIEEKLLWEESKGKRRMEKLEGTQIKCLACGHVWHTRSKAKYPHCPSCGSRSTTTNL